LNYIPVVNTKHKRRMCAFVSQFGFAVKNGVLYSGSAMAQVSNNIKLLLRSVITVLPFS